MPGVNITVTAEDGAGVALGDVVKDLLAVKAASEVADGQDGNGRSGLVRLGEDAESSGARLERLRLTFRGLDTDARRSRNIWADMGRGLDDLGRHLDHFSLAGKLISSPFRLLGDAFESFAGTGAGIGLADTLSSIPQALSGLVGSIPAVGGSLVQLGASAGEAAAELGPLGLGIAAVGAALAVWPTIIGAATGAVSLFAQAVSIVAAPLVALIPPVTVLSAVLGGGLLAGFLSFKTLMSASGSWAEPFHKTISAVEKSFGSISTTLGHLLMPAFVGLGHAAETSLGIFARFLSEVGKDGLGQALNQFAAGGGGFSKINSQIESAISPIGSFISQAVAFAFGRGGARGKVLLGQDFGSLSSWISKTFQPVIAWWNHQHLEKTGTRWANELTTAIMGSQGWAKMWAAVQSGASMAGSAAAGAFVSAFESEVEGLGLGVFLDDLNPVGATLRLAGNSFRSGPHAPAVHGNQGRGSGTRIPGHRGAPQIVVNQTMHFHALTTRMAAQHAANAISREIRRAGT